MEAPPPLDSVSPIISVDVSAVLYLASSSTLGLISAFAALMGDERKKLTWRAVTAYLTAGALVSLGITLFLVEEYGFSYPLLGVSIFAGYKAFDTLAVLGMAVGTAVSSLVKKFFSNK
jgi:hypothetical protein